jgi:hypothetical protein
MCVCVFAHSGAQHILCCVFVFVCLVFCVPNVASFSGLSISYCSFGILWRLLDCAVNFPSLTNWFHFTIWETRIAETSRVLYDSPTLSLITTCTCKVPITCLPASPARSFWTFGHCDFVTKTYLKVLFFWVLHNWKNHLCVNYVTLLWTTLQEEIAHVQPVSTMTLEGNAAHLFIH